MEEKVYRVFSVNPGSTSTKVALFENEKKVTIASVFHDSSLLKTFPTINDQLDYRMEVVEKFLKEKNIDLMGIDAIVGRGGASYSVCSGVYNVSDKLVEDTKQAKGGLYHSSMLGVQMAKRLHDKYGGLCLMMNPTVTDEYDDIARVTGVKGVYRHSICHALNLKEVARMYSEEVGKKYEELRLITAHIDGGISAMVHQNGRMIDGYDGGGGEGPFTPTRMGSMAITDFNNNFHDLPFEEVRKLTSVAGGLSSYFNTSNSDVIHKMVEDGNSEAVRVWNAMIYQCCKMIGSLSTVLSGKVDAIVLTGGLCRFSDVVNTIKERCGFIAPIKVYSGEYEHEAMTNGALRVLRNQEKAKEYTGVPVFEGFEEDK